MNCLKYKGFSACVEFSAEDNVLFGKIDYIKDLVNFESTSAEGIVEEFHKAVDDYLAFCESVGKEPEKPFTGNFNVRIAPELHRRAAAVARANNESLNAFVAKAVSDKLDSADSNLNLTVNIKQDIDVQNYFTPVVKQRLWDSNDNVFAHNRLNR